MKDPKIIDARKLCEALGARGVIVLAFDSSRYAAASYGTTTGECRSLARLEDSIVSQLDSGKLPVWEWSP